MTTSETRADLVVRPFEPDDEAAVLPLLTKALGPGPGGDRSADFFRWKHFENPFGSSLMYVGQADQAIVGLRAFMRWRFVVGERTVEALRAVDTATHPAFQGRGIFRRLTLVALDAARGGSDLVFNTPNEKSLPGYLKMGWQPVGTMSVRVRVRRPLRFAVRLRSVKGDPTGEPMPIVEAETAEEALRDADGVEQLIAETEQPGGGFATLRTLAFLRWRYAPASSLDYRAVREERDGRLCGLCLFRVRPRGRLWESTIAEILVADGDRRTALRLMRGVASAAPVDHLTMRFPRGSASARAARRWGAMTGPLGMTFVVNPLRPGIEPDPTRLASWDLSLGDLEVF